MIEITYLGDGVYASFDGYQIKLEAHRESGLHVIYLEPQVLAALNSYYQWATAPATAAADAAESEER